MRKGGSYTINDKGEEVLQERTKDVGETAEPIAPPAAKPYNSKQISKSNTEGDLDA